VARAAHQQAEPDDAVEDDHHGCEHCVAGERDGGRAPGDHERDDERHLDHSDRECQHQGAEGFADSMGDHLGVVHGREHAGDQAGTERDRKEAVRDGRRCAKQQPAGKGRGHGPEWQMGGGHVRATCPEPPRHRKINGPAAARPAGREGLSPDPRERFLTSLAQALPATGSAKACSVSW
jgi:hypothetical protein